MTCPDDWPMTEIAELKARLEAAEKVIAAAKAISHHWLDPECPCRLCARLEEWEKLG